jgi:phosphoglycolate phosphatase-like HAD superfamily hydrolase
MSLRLAWLFDVDGTLLFTDGAARAAFAGAVRDQLGVEDDLADVPFAGRTEPLILADILGKHGRSFDAPGEARFWNSVYDHMRHELRPGRGRVMPGIPALLDRIAAVPGWGLGLLTGNMTQMARIKLGHFGLDGRFAFGGFGEMAPDRDALARALVRRVGREHGVPAPRCVVVGDTEHDIACARAAGARVIAVATGTASRAELEALQPDLLLDDLADAEAVLAWGRAVGADDKG